MKITCSVRRHISPFLKWSASCLQATKAHERQMLSRTGQAKGAVQRIADVQAAEA